MNDEVYIVAELSDAEYGSKLRRLLDERRRLDHRYHEIRTELEVLLGRDGLLPF